MDVRYCQTDWEFKTPFRIAYRTRTHARSIKVELVTRSHVGRGEALGVSYHGETIESLLDQVSDTASDLRNGISRQDLQLSMPPGGARNAIDCALWDLEAKIAGRRAWEIAGLGAGEPVFTDYTLGIDTPEAMARSASELLTYPLLKLKLNGDADDIERVRAVRAARPNVELIIDANQSWKEESLVELTSIMKTLDVKLIEQPLPVDKDECLANFKSPVPICADESCQTTASLEEIVGKYDYINIKLDKTGGLTEALRLARAGAADGLGLMVGCMGGSSLSMAPAWVVGQLCRYADLDGPLLSNSDLPDPIVYIGNMMAPPSISLWG